VFGPGNHGTTFGGNPLAMRAALETIAIIESEGLMANAAHVGAHIMSAMARELAGERGLVEIRGAGLMIGIELHAPCAVIALRALDAGLLCNVTNDRVIRLLPPLIFTIEQADLLVSILAPIVKAFLAEAYAAELTAKSAP
jgi:acetylornithine/N-succinyldiaminopimelate aminotransferase